MKLLNKILFVSYLLLLSPVSQGTNSIKVVKFEDLDWGYLNPLRGDKSPGAADLWGNRKTDNSTGMLVRFNKGFSSPPHIHNVSYRGIVIEGAVHNDDPGAKPMWLPPGSFWTQPAGEEHITAANGVTNLIYLEIDQGPYLVHPVQQGFDNGEIPLNLHRQNMVWQPMIQDTKCDQQPQVAFAPLWGSPCQGQPGGTLIKFGPGFSGKLRSDGSMLRLVVITGQFGYHPEKGQTALPLSPGSYLQLEEEIELQVSTASQTMVYIRTEDCYQISRD